MRYYQITTVAMKKQATKDQCPLDGKCSLPSHSLNTNVIKLILGPRHKERYRNRTGSFRHQSKRNETEPSDHIWTLKDNNKLFSIKWRKLLCSGDLIKTLATNVIYVWIHELASSCLQKELCDLAIFK